MLSRTAGARCYVQVILAEGAESGSASLGEIDHAASELVTKCAWERNSGGIATNIGFLFFIRSRVALEI